MTWSPVPASTQDPDSWPPVLNGWFSHYLFVDLKDVAWIVKLLASPREGVPNGSSFIVDADAPAGQRRIWLSPVSLMTLERYMEEHPLAE